MWVSLVITANQCKEHSYLRVYVGELTISRLSAQPKNRSTGEQKTKKDLETGVKTCMNINAAFQPLTQSYFQCTHMTDKRKVPSAVTLFTMDNQLICSFVYCFCDIRYSS